MSRPGSVFCSDECHDKYADANLPNPNKQKIEFEERLREFKKRNSVVVVIGGDDSNKSEEQATEEYFERLFGRIEEYEQSRGLRR